MSKLVSAALVIAKRQDGSDVYVYAGAPLPDGLAEGEADRLAEFLEDDDKPAAKKAASKSEK
jgi:hypothetical protein